MALTDTAIKILKQKNKTYRIADAEGLAIECVIIHKISILIAKCNLINQQQTDKSMFTRDSINKAFSPTSS